MSILGADNMAHASQSAREIVMELQVRPIRKRTITVLVAATLFIVRNPCAFLKSSTSKKGIACQSDFILEEGGKALNLRLVRRLETQDPLGLRATDRSSLQSSES